MTRIFKQLFLLTTLTFNISAMYEPVDVEIKIKDEVDEKESASYANSLQPISAKVAKINEFIRKKLNKHITPEISQIIIDYGYIDESQTKYFLSQEENWNNMIPLDNDLFIIEQDHGYGIVKLDKATKQYILANESLYSRFNNLKFVSCNIISCLFCCFPSNAVYNCINLGHGLIAHCQADGTIRICKLTNKSFDNTQTLNKNICWLLNNPCGYFVEQFTRCFLCCTKFRRCISKKGTDTVTNLIQLRDGSLVHSIKEDRTIKIWKLLNGRYCYHQTITTHHEKDVSKIVELQTGFFASLDYDKIKIWKLTDNKYIHFQTIGNESSITKLILLQDNSFAFCANTEIKKFKLNNELNKYYCINSFKDINHITDIIELSDQSLVSCANKEITVRTNDKVYCLGNEHHRWIKGIIQLQDGSLASYEINGTIIIWKLKDSQYKYSQTLETSYLFELTQLNNEELVAHRGNRTRIWANEISKIQIPEDD